MYDSFIHAARRYSFWQKSMKLGLTDDLSSMRVIFRPSAMVGNCHHVRTLTNRPWPTLRFVRKRPWLSPVSTWRGWVVVQPRPWVIPVGTRSQPSHTFSAAPPCGGVSSFSSTPLSAVPDLLIDRQGNCDVMFGWSLANPNYIYTMALTMFCPSVA